MKNAVLLIFIVVLVSGCAEEKKQPEQTVLTKPESSVTSESVKTKAVVKEPVKQGPLVTFVELGSVNCIPCKMMQPVMKAVEEAYKEKVKVIFYDVWTEAGKPFGAKYGINVIPTQVFLDKDGKEFFRHEGYFPREDIEALLEKQGVKK